MAKVASSARRLRIASISPPSKASMLLDQLSDSIVAERAQGGLLGDFRQSLVDRAAGALGAVDRGDRGLQSRGNLLCREAQNLARDRHPRAAAAAGAGARGDEGKLGRLAALSGPRATRGRPRGRRSRRTKAPRLAGRAARRGLRRRRPPEAVVDRQHHFGRRAIAFGLALVAISCRARSGASCERRSREGRASCAASRPGGRRRRREASRASGSSGLQLGRWGSISSRKCALVACAGRFEKSLLPPG